MERNQHWHKQALGSNYLAATACCKSPRWAGEAGLTRSMVLESTQVILKALKETNVGELEVLGILNFSESVYWFFYYVEIFGMVQKWIIWNSCLQASYSLYGETIYIQK